MRIRNGFVSNSSSSSFLVAFPSKPASVKDVKEMVFGDLEWFGHPYNEESYSAMDVSEIIWGDINTNGEVGFDTAADHIHALPDFRNFEISDFKIDWLPYELSNKKILQDFMEKYKDHTFYCFDYEDNTQLGCAMEHGDLFCNLPHLVSSNH